MERSTGIAEFIFNRPRGLRRGFVLRNDDVDHMTREPRVISTGRLARTVAEGVSP